MSISDWTYDQLRTGREFKPPLWALEYRSLASDGELESAIHTGLTSEIRQIGRPYQVALSPQGPWVPKTTEGEQGVFPGMQFRDFLQFSRHRVTQIARDIVKAEGEINEIGEQFGASIDFRPVLFALEKVIGQIGAVADHEHAPIPDSGDEPPTINA